jgi:hypothetical protein
MRTLKLFSIVSSLLISTAAFADLVKVYSGPAIPRCPGNEDSWKNRWSLTINVDDASEKEDFIKLFRVIGSGGFHAEGFLNFGQVDTFIDLTFNEEYFASNPAKGEQVLTKGLETLASLNGVYIQCSPIYRPAPALTVRN